MNKVVIDGEAPETDSEDELNSNKTDTPSRVVKSIQGAVIVGEDSESDDDIYGASISSAVSALQTPSVVKGNENTHVDNEEEKFNSLLHKKLKERNRSLSNNIQTYTHNIITEANRSLTNTDQQLLKSQVTLQSGIASLRTLNQHAALLNQKINTIVTSNFFQNVQLPTVNTDNQSQSV